MFQEDVHFLIDNATPIEVSNILKLSSQDVVYSNENFRSLLQSEFSFVAQKDIAYSTRRLFDLKLLKKEKTIDNKPGYILTDFGLKIKNILFNDIEFFWEIMHYLHYQGYRGNFEDRKLFWSYKKSCDFIWYRNEIPKTEVISAYIQDLIEKDFPLFFSKKVGGNFNIGGVNSWKSWILTLDPKVISNDIYNKRVIEKPELVLIALNFIYETKNIRFGDSIILDDLLIEDLCKVFFIEETNCKDLLSLASKVTDFIKFKETFGGISINLLKPFLINEL